MAASGRHFFNGSTDRLAAQIDGLAPARAASDEPYAFVEPNTGLSVKVRVALQLNARLKRSSGANDDDASSALRMFEFATIVGDEMGR